MKKIEDLNRAKDAHDYAWQQATSYANEAYDALEKHRQIAARDTDSIFMQKAKRALVAYDNWVQATNVSRKVMDEYFAQIRPDNV